MIPSFQISSTDVLIGEPLKQWTFSIESRSAQTEEFEIKRIKNRRPQFSWFYAKSFGNTSAYIIQPFVYFPPIESFESAATVEQRFRENFLSVWSEHFIANQKLKELKLRHFTASDRIQRIAQANAALDKSLLKYALDKETWQWIAEDVDLEDI